MQYRYFDGGFLIVSGDDELARQVEAAAQCAAPVRRVLAPDEAEGVTRQHADWCGFVVDLEPDPEPALRLIGQIRGTWATAPIVAVSRRPNPRLLNDLARLDAQVLSKPLGGDVLEPFVRRARAEDPSTSARGRVVRRLAEEYGLTRRETEVLRLSVEGWTVEAITRCLGIKAKTYESHVTRLLRKSGVQRLSELTIQILLEAHGARPDPSWVHSLLRPPTPALGITRDQIRAHLDRSS